jgi:hypothetical protein
MIPLVLIPDGLAGGGRLVHGAVIHDHLAAGLHRLPRAPGRLTRAAAVALGDALPIWDEPVTKWYTPCLGRGRRGDASEGER